MTRRGLVFALFIGIAVVVAGCGSPRSAARAKLKQMGVAYSQESFIEQAAQGNLAAVQLFLEAGMDPDTRAGEVGRTVLGAATEGGHADVVRALLEAGADANQKDWLGRTPLIIVAETDHADLVPMLVGAGADLDVEYADYPLLTYAVTYGYADVVRALIEAGADVNVKDRAGGTPLHSTRSPAMVRILIEAGADINAKNIRGLTRLWLATFTGEDEIAQILREAGAEE
ncbi:MAG: ankyrin repeat domain-containing protein [Armatimonadota bacterium]|nr:MAG: ankyrin repeat domain-containing protein [Armatimonadota bacterium]